MLNMKEKKWIKKCYYRGCNSSSSNKNNEISKGISFIGLPNPSENWNRWRKWLESCVLSPDEITKISLRDICICSLHFIGHTGPTSEHPDPILYEMGVNVSGSQNDNLRDVALRVINDQARVMLEHSYVSLGVMHLPTESIPSSSLAATEIENPCRSFNNAPLSRPRLLSPRASKAVVTTAKNSSKLLGSSSKNRGTQLKRLVKRRKKRKCICKKKTTTKKKLIKERVPSNSNQEAFTFIGVNQIQGISFRENLPDFEEVKIKEEILDESNSDTLSAPSPKMTLDSFSDDETESYNSNYLSKEFVRTTIVKECNLPDNPESDPLSFAFSDLDRKDNPVVNFCRQPASSIPSVIHFSLVPKEESEDKFVPCFGSGEISSHELALSGHVNTDGWSAPRYFSRYSEFACGVKVKEEKPNDFSSDISSSTGIDTSRKVSMPEIFVGSPNSHSAALKAPTAECPIVGSSACNERTGDRYSGHVTSTGSEITDATALVPGNAQKPNMNHTNIQHTVLNYSCANHIPVSRSNTPQSTLLTPDNVVIHSDGYHVELQKVSNGLAEKMMKANESVAAGVDLISKVCGSTSTAYVENSTNNATSCEASMGTSPGNSFSTKTCAPGYVWPVEMLPHSSQQSSPPKVQDGEQELPGGTSSEKVQTPPCRVKKKVFVMSSKKVPISAENVSEIIKIVEKKIQVSCGNANMPTGSTQTVPHRVQKMLVVSKSTEAMQKFSLVTERESQELTSQDHAMLKLTDDIGKKVDESLAHTVPKKNSDRILQRDKNNFSFQCTSRPVSSKGIHCSSQAAEGRVTETEPWTTTVPVEMMHIRDQVSPQAAKQVCRTPSSSWNQARPHAPGNEITNRSSGLTHGMQTETSMCAHVMVPEVVNKMTTKVDSHPASVGALNQSIERFSPLPEVHPSSNLESVYSQVSQFNSMTSSSSLRNLLSHRVRYVSTVDKLNKRMRFLSRLRTIMGNKNFRPYKMS